MRSPLHDIIADSHERAEKEVYGKTTSFPRAMRAAPTTTSDRGAAPNGDTTYAVNVDLGEGKPILKNVPISREARDVIYTEPGAAVTLWKNPTTGKYSIIGFAKQRPGDYIRFGIDLVDGTIADPEDLSVRVRHFAYDEYDTLRTGYGSVAYGSWGLYQGDTLLEIL